MTRPPTPTVWVVSELYHPEETSTGFFLTGIAEALALDRTVRVICSQPTYSARGALAPTRETWRGVDIQRSRSTTFPKDVVPLRLINAFTFTAGVFLRALRGFRDGDLVLTVTNPPMMPYAVALAARLRGARVLLLVHDVYPEVLVATGVARPDALPVRVLDRMSRWLYRSSERIVVLGRDMQRLIAAKVPTSMAHRVVVIPNWGEVAEVTPTPRATNPVLARIGIGDRFVVNHMGNLGRTHGLAALVEAAQLLDRADAAERALHFLFIGWGARQAWLEKRSAELGLRNLTLLPPAARAELSAHLNAADVALIAFKPGMSGVSVPSRMYNVMAAGKPIIAVADDDSELARVVREERIGFVVEPDQPDALVAALRNARALEPAELRMMGDRAREAALRLYSREHVTGQFRELFDSLAAS